MKLRVPYILLAGFHFVAASPQLLEAQQGDVYGVVVDSLTRQRIPSANVTILGTTRGAATNNVGFYVIAKLPPGAYEVAASVMGYQKAIKSIALKAGKSEELNFELRSKPVEEQEVVVTGSRKTSQTGKGVSAYVLDHQDLRSVPVAAQQDLLQSLKILPGIVSTSDVSSRFYVRGGSGDQNLFLFNGTRIYYPFHALGIFSVFDPSIVDNVEVHTAAFPPGYGGRLSSVVNITTRDGRSDRISGEGSINFLSAKVQAEGPALRNASWLLDVRKSLSSRTLSRIVGQDLPVSFYDAAFKLSLQPGGVLKHDFTFLSSGDVLRSPAQTVADYQWRNNAFSLTGVYLPTSRVLVQWLIYGTVYAANRDAKMSTSVTSQSTSVSHYGLRCASTVYSGPKDQYDFGFEFNVPSLGFNFMNRLRKPSNVRGSFLDVSAWFRYQVQSERTHFDLGLHAELAALFEGSGIANELQPRLGLSHELNGGWNLKLSYGRFSQRVMTVGNEDEVISIFEGWIKIPSNVPSERADHMVLGLSGNLAPMISLTTELYNKRYSSLVVYNWNKYNVSDPDYVQGTSSCYGIETMLRSKVSWVDLYGAYSLAWSWTKNQGLTYSPRYDRRHHIHVLAVGHPTRGLDVALKWEFGSGFPYSQSTGYIEHLSLDNSLPGRFEYADLSYVMLFGAKNAARLPAYHRLDANCSYTAELWGLQVAGGIDLLNLYDNKNIFYFDRQTGQRINMIAFFPSVSLSVRY